MIGNRQSCEIGTNFELLAITLAISFPLKPLILLHFLNPPDFSQVLVSRYPYMK